MVRWVLPNGLRDPVVFVWPGLFRCDWHVKAVAKVLGESQSSDIVRRQRQEPGRSAPRRRD